MSWPVLAGISASVPILSLLLMMFLPETPNFLVSQHKADEARKALRKFRGSTCDIDAELKILTDFSQKNNLKKVKGLKGRPSQLLTYDHW